jgi:hypothetical protein
MTMTMTTPTLSADVGAYAPGHRMTDPRTGKVYEFSHLTLAKQAEFERENFRQHRERLRELREDYGEAEYLTRLDGLRERYERHEFRFEATFLENKTLPLILLLLRVLTGATEEELWSLLAAESGEVLRLVALVVKESFPTLPPQEGSFPNGLGPIPRPPP